MSDIFLIIFLYVKPLIHKLSVFLTTKSRIKRLAIWQQVGALDCQSSATHFCVEKMLWIIDYNTGLTGIR